VKEEIILKQNNQTYFRFEVTNFIIQNNLPFNFADKFAKFLKQLLQTHTVDALQNFSVNTKHITRIASQCIGPSLQEKYLKMLSQTFFSLSLDEGSVKGSIEYLNVSARFFDTDSSERTVTKLLGVLQLNGSSEGKTLYDLVESFLFNGPDGKLRKEKLIGIATDHGSNMISSKAIDGKGVTNRFKADLPYLIIIHDFCHALNLVLEQCLEAFPTEFTKIISKIASIFSRSPNKTARLIKDKIAGQTSDNDSEKYQK